MVKRLLPHRPQTRQEITARWRANNPEKMRKAKRAYRLKEKGLTMQQFADILQAQGGGCAICGRPHVEGDTRNALVVDHRHSTGANRGLLCHWCNRAIGLMKDSAFLLRRAAEYLESKGHDGA